MAPDRPRIGHAKVVLVPDGAHKEQAVVSTIIARAVDARSAERITFSGPLAFERRAAAHIRQTVVPVADAILRHLGVCPPCFEVAIANLGATAAAELDSQVSGFSADLPTLLSSLSAALGIAVPDDIICTGHIASPNGEVRAVKAIPAKLRAAIADASLRRFVHPSLRNDTSLTTLTPKEAERAEAAILEARDRIRTIAVCDVGDLVRAVFEKEQAMIASMRMDYFANPVSDAWADHPTGRAALFFMTESDQRFWKSVQQNLLAGTIDTAKQLLESYTGFHLGRQLYPEAFGRKLMLLLRSLPPADRRLRNMFPLIATGDCIKLSQFVSTTDHEDVPLLLDAASGRHISWRPLEQGCDHGDSVGTQSPSPTAVDTVVSRLRAEYLARHIGLPIDNARAAYVSETVTVESKDAFSEVITAFYVHLERHTHSIGSSIKQDAVAAGAHRLLDETFAKRGGYKAAFAEARDGTRGGLRFVLDAMTEQFKANAQRDYVNLVFREALEGLDLPSQIEFMGALLDRLAPALPPELRDEPPEHFVNNLNMIVRAYVRSLDQVNDLLRTL